MTPYYSFNNIIIYQGDALTCLREIETNSIQCCVTSPPYWTIRDYGVPGQIGLEPTIEEYISNLVDVFGEVRRVLKKDGTCWINLGDTYANDSKWGGKSGNKNYTSAAGGISCERKATGVKDKNLCMIPARVALSLQASGWYLRSQIPWIKRNCMPESCKDRPTTAVEYIYLLSKSERYYYDHGALKLPASLDTHARYARGRSNNHKYADGGPGNQTIAKTFEHIPGVNPKAQRTPTGWQQGPGAHDKIPKGHYPGTGVGWDAASKNDPTDIRKDRNRIKQNSSFSAAVKDKVETRARRNSDWFFESWRGLLTNEDGAPLAMLVNSKGTKDAHFATFPEAMAEPCIIAGSRIGDTVLDMFVGSGTTLRVASRLHRKGIGIELKKEYIDDIVIKKFKQNRLDFIGE